MIPYALMIVSMVSIMFGMIRTESVDMVEVNRYHNRDGDIAYTQVVFWDWDHEDNQYHCRAWTMLDREDKRPFVMYPGGIVRSKWIGIDKQETEINAVFLRESWSQVDPEREDGKQYPESKRRGFCK